jgi:PAS domain-containing protein
MFPKEIEVILTRHLASCLAMPIIIVDPEGTLIFYNESAEAILGRRFEETGEITASEWAGLINPVSEEGEPIPSAALPLATARSQQRPVHRRFWIHGMDGVRRHIESTAFPIIGQAERFLGAVAIFWEIEEERDTSSR